MTAGAVLDTRGAVQPIECPYVGLVPFSAEQRRYFFGRDRDIDLLSANVQAFGLTILYGPSGVGKSSVVLAGVVPHLRAQADGDPALVVSVSTWRDDPSAALDAAAASGARHLRTMLPPVNPASPLDDRLRSWAYAMGGAVYCIFDQFEDYFLYHEDPGERFGRELAACLAMPVPPAHFLISLREDALGKLDRFRPYVPNLYSNQYRLTHLTGAEARQAIIGPIDRHNAEHPADDALSIEPALVDAVLAEVRTGEVVVGATGEGRVAGGTVRDEIETAHLQLVMMRLWEAEAAEGSSQLRLDTLQRLGGSESIVRSHLDATMEQLEPAERDVAAGVFRQLVTPSGAKIAHSIDDLAEYAEVEEATLAPVLERLADGDTRVLRGVPPAPGRPDSPRYEIFHDALGPAILDWCTRRTSDQARLDAERRLAASRASLRRERRRRGRLAILLCISLALLVGMGFVLYRTILADRHRQNADRLAAQAMATVDVDPAAAAALALEAWDRHHTAAAEEALRLSSSSLLESSELDDPDDDLGDAHADKVTSVSVAPGSEWPVLTTSEDGTAKLWDEAGESITLDGHTSAVGAGRFSPDGSTVVTWEVDGTVHTFDAMSGEPLNTFEDVGWPMWADEAVDMSADGQRLAYVSGDFTGVHVVDIATGRETSWDLSEDGAAPDDAQVRTIRFDSVDPSIVFTGDDYGWLRAWSIADDRQLASIQYDLGLAIDTLAPSPDGTTIAGGTADSTTLMWRWQEPVPSEEPVNPQVLYDARQGLHHVEDLDFSADGNSVVVAAAKTATMFTYDADYKKWFIAGRANHVDWTQSVDFAPDGEFFVSVGRDGAGLVVDPRTNLLLAELRGDSGDLTDVAVAADGSILTAGGDGTVRVWRMPATKSLRAHEDWVIGMDVTSDQSTAVTAGTDGRVVIWELAAGVPSDTIEEVRLDSSDPDGKSIRMGKLNPAAISPSGEYVAVSGDLFGLFFHVWLWHRDADGVEQVGELDGQARSLAFSPDGTTLAVATFGRVDLWTMGEAAPTRGIDTPDKIATLAWSKDGSRLAGGFDDGGVVVWDSDLDEVATMEGHVGEITDVVFSPDGERLATSGQDRTARIWDVGSGEELHVLRGHDVRVATVDFSEVAADEPDQEGRVFVVTGDANGFVGVWDGDSGHALSLSRVHSDSVNEVELLPDGRIMSASDDEVVRIRECGVCGLSIDDLVDDLEARLDGLAGGDDDESTDVPDTNGD